MIQHRDYYLRLAFVSTICMLYYTEGLVNNPLTLLYSKKKPPIFARSLDKLSLVFQQFEGGGIILA